MLRPTLFAITALGLGALVYAAVSQPDTPPADASFHLMRVHGVMRGFMGNTTIQYVELRMASEGQTQVSGHDICFFDPSGNPWARFTFPGNVQNGASGSSILVGSPGMDALWPHDPDFVFGPGNTVGFDISADTRNPVYEGFGQGKVAFGSDSAAVPADMCGAQFNVIDSIAYGTTYSGPVDFGTQFGSDLPFAGESALRLTGPLCAPPCARDNSADYSIVDLADPANYPRNNAGQSGALGDGGTPTPSPTPGQPTPTPTPGPSPSSGPQMQGDVNCDDLATSVDALFILREVAGLGAGACAGNGDVNCDGNRTSVDALGVLRYVASLPVNQNEPCPDIGTPA